MQSNVNLKPGFVNRELDEHGLCGGFGGVDKSRLLTKFTLYQYLGARLEAIDTASRQSERKRNLALSSFPQVRRSRCGPPPIHHSASDGSVADATS
jgi:hypothetical protein